jgi:hypothetical protein
LIAPCGGSSGFPNVAARAFAATVTIAPVAVAVSMSRLEIMVYSCYQSQGRSKAVDGR